MKKSPAGENGRLHAKGGTGEDGSRMAKLSARLGALFDLIPPCPFAVDVGCDHGYIPIALVRSGKCENALACDVRPGPLNKAEEHIRAAGLEDRIRTVLSDGLKNPEIFSRIRNFSRSAGQKDPAGEDKCGFAGEDKCGSAREEKLGSAGENKCRKDSDDEDRTGTLIIAGMGGILMRDILENAPALKESFSCLVLQPQSDLSFVREWLSRNGWRIRDEFALVEDGKYYEGFAAEQGRMVLTPEEARFGPVLLRSGNPAVRDHLLKQKEVRENILKELEESREERILSRRGELQEERILSRRGDLLEERILSRSKELQEELEQIEAGLALFENGNGSVQII